MNNQNSNQNNNSPVDNQNLLNQGTDQVSNGDFSQPDIGGEESNSVNVKMPEASNTNQLLDPPFVSEPQMSEKPQTIPTQATETPLAEEKQAIKDFNSIPIDTPSPVLLGDNLEPSKSLTETPLSVSENKPEMLSQPNVNVTPESTPEPEYELKPEPKIETEMNSDYKPEPVVQTETNVPTVSQEDPEKIKQKIDEVLSYNTTNNVENSNITVKKVSPLLKILFIISLVIFLFIVGGLAYFIFYQPSKTSSNSTETPTPSTSNQVQTTIVCELNGFIYNQGQSFPSSDGCNTCTCESADNIVCTEKQCDVVTTPITSVTPTTNSPIVTPKVSTASPTKKIVPTLTKSAEI